MAVIYDYYRIFYYVAKYRSFTRAARILQNSQPNITRTMNNLERELNCRLFVRSNRGVTLTPEGEKLFARVQIAQEQLQAAEYELTRGQSLQSGLVSLGASEIALHILLLPVLRDFRLRHPGVRLQVTNHSTPQAVAAVKSGLVELAVVSTPTGAAKPLQEIALAEFQEILVAGKHFSALAGRRLHLGELAGYPLIGLAPETTTHAFYSRLFAAHGLAFEPDIEAATTDQVLPMVEHDLGLGFLPERLARDAVERGTVFRVGLAEPIEPRRICLVKDKSRPLSLAAQELERLLRAAARGNIEKEKTASNDTVFCKDLERMKGIEL